jgi:histidinol-phosphatase (PHP family)
MSNTLIESDIFDIIAHPDLIRCHSLYPSYDLKSTYKNLCENAKNHGVAIEMNTSKGNGINKEFLDIALESGVTFSTGSDAHRPEDVGRGIEEVNKLICRK